MYLLPFIIAFVGFIFLGLVWKLLRGIFKTIITALLLGIIVLGATLSVLYLDYQSVESGLEENAVLTVEHSNRSVVSLNITRTLGTASVVEGNVSNASLHIFVDTSAFRNTTVQFVERNLSYQTYEEVLESSTLEEAAASITDSETERTVLITQYDSVADVQRDLSLLFIQEKLRDGANEFLIDGLKEETVRVEPDLMTTKVIEYIPTSIIDNAVESQTNESE